MADRRPNNDAPDSVMSFAPVDDMPSPTCHDCDALHERLPPLGSGHLTSKNTSLMSINISPPRIRTLNFSKTDGAKIKTSPKKAMGKPSIPKVSSKANVSGRPIAPQKSQHLDKELTARKKLTENAVNDSAWTNGMLVENAKRAEPQDSRPPMLSSVVSKPGGDLSVKREDDDENNIPRWGGYLTLPSKPTRDSIPSPLDSLARIAASPMPATPRRTRAIPPRRLPLKSSPPSPRRPPGNGLDQRTVAIASDASVIHVKEEEDDASGSQAVGKRHSYHFPGLSLTLADEMSIAQDPREPDDILDTFEFAGVGTKHPHV